MGVCLFVDCWLVDVCGCVCLLAGLGVCVCLSVGSIGLRMFVRFACLSICVAGLYDRVCSLAGVVLYDLCVNRCARLFVWWVYLCVGCLIGLFGVFVLLGLCLCL